MSVEELERINDEGLAAWDAGDAEAFVGLFANDFVWIDWTQPAPITDREAALAYVRSWTRPSPT